MDRKRKAAKVLIALAPPGDMWTCGSNHYVRACPREFIAWPCELTDGDVASVTWICPRCMLAYADRWPKTKNIANARRDAKLALVQWEMLFGS